MAPSESFGMTIRESILRGVPVVALKNAGTMFFKESFPDSVHICDDLGGAIQVLQKAVNCTLSDDIVERNREEQSQSNMQAINALVNSWIGFESN